MLQHRSTRAAVLLAVTFAAFAGRASAASNTAAPSAGWSPTEKWAWSQIVTVERDSTVDMIGHCPRPSGGRVTELDPSTEKDPRWADACLTISARFLRDVLTRSPWRDAVPSYGMGLSHAHVVGDIDLQNAKLMRAIWLVNSRIDGEFSLLRARTDSLISLVGTHVAGSFIADGLQSDSDVQLRLGTFEQEFSLNRARVTGQVDMTGATVNGRLNAQGLQAFDVFLRSDDEAQGARGVFAGTVAMIFSRIGNTLDMRGASLSDVNLTGAVVTGDFALGTRGKNTTEWKNKNGTPSTLNLHNAQVGNLADKEAAWPSRGHLRIGGFSFAHLSGAAGKAGKSPDHEPLDWWVRLDTDYSVSPYAQLVTVLTGMGDRGAAHRIEFLARQRAREADWDSSSFGAWAGQTFLLGVAGYGIGGYTFIVLLWVFGLAAAGGLVLYKKVPCATTTNRGLLWSFGASLSRLLPVIEINKEFTEFFNDPDRKRLKTWQPFAFDCLGIIGWVLGALLIAAMSGLTQNP